MTQSVNVDQEARDLANEAISMIRIHTRGCEENARTTVAFMKDIKSILAWGITGLIGSMGGLIVWLATHPPH